MDAPTCRLLVDPPAGGAWNMAVDEALLESAAGGRGPVLRLYGWSRPTLSLGYFQAADARDKHAASRECDLVRRASGGGAIVHHHELTYCLALSETHPLARRPDDLYRAVHSALVAALAEFSLAAEMWTAGRSGGEEPLLCFQRRAAGDVVLAGHKIAGSAQRRRDGGVAQHGSILLHRSPAAPELLGLAELGGPQSARELIPAWQPHLEHSLGLRLVPGQLDPEERGRAEQLCRQKYAAAGWTRKR